MRLCASSVRRTADLGLTRLVLASASPRRQALVALLELPVRTAPADIDEESYLVGAPAASAVNVAAAKARAVPDATAADEIVLAADTLVVLEAEILGKPASAAAARGMLRRLRNRSHQVMTGVALRSGDLDWAGVVTTLVQMRAYTDAEVAAYIARGEPFDKAGGYAVQDATFGPVERLTGCYLNVVGLPLCAVSAGLNALGVGMATAGPPPCGYCERGAPLVRSG